MRWFHWIIVALSLCLTVFAWHYSQKQLQAKTVMKFDRNADHAVALVKERMANYEDALCAGVAFIATNDGVVDYSRWNTFASAIQVDKKYPGINGLGIIERVDKSRKLELIASRRIQYPDFHVHPSRSADEYWPITSIVPITGNEKAIGLDMAHESNRITAARKARLTGNAQVTGPIVLVQDSQHTPGFLFYAPFFKKGKNTSQQERAEDFAGLVYAPFVFSKLMEGVLDKKRRQVELRISDSGALLYDESTKSNAQSEQESALSKDVSIPVYGRTWDINIRTTESFGDSVDRTQPMTILIAGFIIDSLLVGLFLFISLASRKALSFADSMTAKLQKLGLAAEVNKIGVWDFDLVNGHLHWDDGMYDLYGIGRDEFGQTFDAWVALLDPQDRETLQKSLGNAVHHSRAFDCEFRILHPDGSTRHISAQAKTFIDSLGNPTRILGASTDVTQRYLATVELEKTMQLQAAIQDYAGVSIIATDIDGTIVAFNKAAEEMLGYRKEELLFEFTPGLFHDPDEVVERAAELSVELQREIAPGFEVFVTNSNGGNAEQREWTYIRKDGSRIPVLLTVTALRDSNNLISGYLGIAADISERKRSVQKIESANADLARSNEALAQFAYAASHDLQEPLRKVTSFCELLQEDCGDQISEAGTLYMKYIVDGAQRMRTLIRDLLEFSRVDVCEIGTDTVEARNAVDLAVENLWEAIRESDAIIEVGELPTVQGNVGQMTQLFQNLIGNAIKYRGDRVPRIRVTCVDSEPNWLFTVEDNGIGIDPRYRKQVFGIFKRLHNQTEYSGTGIGLAICKRIVDRMNGNIWTETSASGGSSFCFELPKYVPFDSNGSATCAPAIELATACFESASSR